MKYVKALWKERAVWGVLKDENIVHFLTDAPYEKIEYTGDTAALSDLTLQAPCDATKIMAAGKNYYDHILESNALHGMEDAAIPTNPTIFMKPPVSINHPEGDIVYPAISARVDYEGELAFVIKKTASKVKRQDYADYILGYTCHNDVTARDVQIADGQWIRGKGFDTFAPLGPILTDEIDISNLDIKTLLNGEVKQHSNTAKFMWDIPTLLEFISAFTTLLPGDVVTTGTPDGIGPMKRGDVVEVVIEGIGTLRNRVV